MTEVFIQSNLPVQLIAPAGAGGFIVDDSDSGKIHLIPDLNNGANTLAITMPTVTDNAGLRYKFICQSLLNAVVTISPAAPTNVVGGTLLNTGGAALINKTGASASAEFTAAATVGDFMDWYCDGTNWWVSGIARGVGFA